MRTQILFDNVDASIEHTVNIPIPCEQDMRFLIQLTKDSTDGNPRLYIEESIDNITWTVLCNYFEIITTPIGIKDNYFMGKYFRVRLVPNGTTTGTVYGIIGYKTKP